MTITLTVNGRRHEIDIEPTEVLADVLRHRLGLTGTKLNCRQGECGACTVIVDGRPMTSCIVLAASVDGSEVTTIEGLGADRVDPERLDPERLDPIQEAFMEADGSQCGFCTPGMVMSTKALLDANPDPSREEIEIGLAGNLCRCTGYRTIVDAVELAAKKRRNL
jgi:aerobic carbon-monoxide dehydrogenase small subunit